MDVVDEADPMMLEGILKDGNLDGDDEDAAVSEVTFVVVCWLGSPLIHSRVMS